MQNLEIVFNSILSKNIFDYILVDKNLDILTVSDSKNLYLSTIPKVGEDILCYFPELVGSEDDIKKILDNPSSKHMLDLIYKNEQYVKISIEYYDAKTLLVLIHNITDSTHAKQKLLQYHNESLLLNNVLQKILDKQNAYTFVTQHNEIAFANKQFLEYFHVESIEMLRNPMFNLYKYFDSNLKSYDALFECVNSKEEYITIENDTFILQASFIESAYKLFTLTKITNISNKLQYDALTKAFKKEYFNTQLEKTILLDEHAAVVVLDLDNFKQVNDKFGHQVGDKVLEEFSALIKDNIREEDVFARWGGEEFLLLLKHTTLENAMYKVETLCKLIETYSFKNIGHITASLGVAWVSDKDTLHSVILRADKALYEAKKAGKNRVTWKILKNLKK